MTELEQKRLELLTPHFDRLMHSDDYDLPEIARITDIGYGQVVSAFSRYLVTYRTERKEVLEGERCPSCGRLKHEVTDPAVCRDLIHYL